MSEIIARLFVFLQKVLPKHLLTLIVYRLARVRITWIKNLLIRRFVDYYSVNLEEVSLRVPDEFESFNAFFVRELLNDARPIVGDTNAIVSPVDGTVSAAGTIDKDSIMQAKGIRYSLTDLLATDTDEAETFVDGAYATFYLAPYNYHRVHAPLAGELVAARYVPGDLFSVDQTTVAKLPGLFVRNERLICRIKTGMGPMMLIFVGAMNVGSISTIWSGELRPRKSGVVERIDIRSVDCDLQFQKGDMLGWFNMGSTVILLHPPAATDGFAGLTGGRQIKVGQVIGRTRSIP